MVKDASSVVEYLRRDVLRNNYFLQAAEKNVPPVPREIRAAVGPDGAMLGVMFVEEFPHGKMACVRADSSAALRVLLGSLNPQETYGFVVQDDLRKEFLESVSNADLRSETVAMTLAPSEFCPFEIHGELRRLHVADKALTDAFPECGPHEPPLSSFVEWAENKPESMAAFGLLADGEIVSYVEFAAAVDNMWEVSMIRTRAEARRKGFAEAVLSYGSGELLREGMLPLYRVDQENVASIKTARREGRIIVSGHMQDESAPVTNNKASLRDSRRGTQEETIASIFRLCACLRVAQAGRTGRLEAASR